MTNYQECTTQWQNLEQLFRCLRITMRNRKKYDQIVMHKNHANGAERKRLQRAADALAADLLIDGSYYRKRAHDLDGIKIAKGQVSFEEFEALLYFAEVTGEDREKWFYDFSSVYPWITYAWDKRNVV